MIANRVTNSIYHNDYIKDVSGLALIKLISKWKQPIATDMAM